MEVEELDLASAAQENLAGEGEGAGEVEGLEDRA